MDKTIIEQQMPMLRRRAERFGARDVQVSFTDVGTAIVSVLGMNVQGWNKDKADILFEVPIGYPSECPSCFYVDGGNFLMENPIDGSYIGKNSHDNASIPRDIVKDRKVTWFAWFLERWEPERDGLATYLASIKQRLSLFV